MITNSHEGDIFLTGIPSSLGLRDYIQNLYPRLNSQQVTTEVNLYSNVSGSVFDQEAAAYGESESTYGSILRVNRLTRCYDAGILICPAYYVLNAFASARKNAWKVRA